MSIRPRAFVAAVVAYHNYETVKSSHNSLATSFPYRNLNSIRLFRWVAGIRARRAEMRAKAKPNASRGWFVVAWSMKFHVLMQFIIFRERFALLSALSAWTWSRVHSWIGENFLFDRTLFPGQYFFFCDGILIWWPEKIKSSDRDSKAISNDAKASVEWKFSVIWFYVLRNSHGLATL